MNKTNIPIESPKSREGFARYIILAVILVAAAYAMFGYDNSSPTIQEFNEDEQLSYDSAIVEYDEIISSIDPAKNRKDRAFIALVNKNIEFYTTYGMLTDEEVSHYEELKGHLAEAAVGGGELLGPGNLFYTCDVADGCKVSQSMREHFANNGMLAVDVATNRHELDMYAPDYNGEVTEYTVEKIQSHETVGKAVKLTFNDNPDWYWIIGHISRYKGTLHNGQSVMTGQGIGKSGGCSNDMMTNVENGEGYSTGCHVHIELWKNGQRVTYPETIGIQHEFEHVDDVLNTETIVQEVRTKVDGIKFTSYNPEVGQTDSTPCIGAAGVDLCRFVRDDQYRLEIIGTTEYIEPIALSQDLVGRHGNKKLTYLDIVEIESEDGDDRCNKKAVVLDTMNARFTNRGDLFFMNRDTNTSCTATVTK